MMPTANLENGSLHYDVTGPDHGTPLVLLLPQSTGPEGRQALIAGLARQHRVITYDQRGTGKSSSITGALSMAEQAADVIGLLDALQLKDTNLLSHSTGCGIGFSLAAHHAQRVRSLVLVSPWMHADTHLTTMQHLRVAAARALDAQQYARFNAALLFPPQYRREHEAGFERMAAAAFEQPQDAEQISGRLEAILAFDTRELLPNISCPTLAAVAADDQLMPAWFAAEAAAGIRGAEYVEFDGGGHMLPETRADELVAAVLAFLAGND
jgi:pimeloyl-ACP methyl ester carboxylesterase